MVILFNAHKDSAGARHCIFGVGCQIWRVACRRGLSGGVVSTGVRRACHHQRLGPGCAVSRPRLRAWRRCRLFALPICGGRRSVLRRCGRWRGSHAPRCGRCVGAAGGVREPSATGAVFSVADDVRPAAGQPPPRWRMCQNCPSAAPAAAVRL